MNERTDSPVAIVTGGTRGIGLAIAEALLQEGWWVFVCGRTASSVESAVRELATQGDSERPVFGEPVDVRDQAQVDAFVSKTLEKTGRVDLLVNNAGLGRFGPVDALSGEVWREVVETNLSGSFYFLRAVSGPMIERGEGWIVNIASLAAKNPFAGGAAYNASKFGLLGLSEAAMLDLRHRGIRVTTILPGSVDTDFRPPSRRPDTAWMLEAEDVAQAVVDLLRYPDRALPSRIELRPSQPPRG